MNAHHKSILISLSSAFVTFIGYVLLELQGQDLVGQDALVIKALLISVFVRSLIKLGSDYISKLQESTEDDRK